MKIYARTSQRLQGQATLSGFDILEVPSTSTSGKEYRVDITHGRCSCPAWINQSGERKPCKHLIALGFQFVRNDVQMELFDKERLDE